ncbi:tryptophan-rich sensory protein [Halobacillus litoralis]|uniref:TspO/MBR family protein n=1 Tax=Halobacillus litoralis TaxID=45668 RepID=UPI001CD34EC7|nr:TspO/MBR family protein [Halobacillus litoralis]MCA0970556.1 tryptophan-rich sensory protein [Halobacillus litoralis]
MRNLLTAFLAYLIVLTVNALANILPLNGQTTGEISNRLNVLFTPAGYVFSIWGLIYLLLGIWLVRQLPSYKRDRYKYRNTRGLFVLSCLLNSLWIFMWHYEFFAVSVVVMLGLLVTLIRLYVRMKDEGGTFFDVLPFSVYLGWVSVATIANISYFLNVIEWNGWGLSSSVWTFLLIIVATILAIVVLFKENDRIYPLVFIWALIGIGVQNAEGGVPVVVYTAYAAAVILTIFVVYRLFKPKKRYIFSK